MSMTSELSWVDWKMWNNSSDVYWWFLYCQSCNCSKIYTYPRLSQSGSRPAKETHLSVSIWRIQWRMCCVMFRYRNCKALTQNFHFRFACLYTIKPSFQLHKFCTFMLLKWYQNGALFDQSCYHVCHLPVCTKSF